MTNQTYHGTCQCGNIRWQFETPTPTKDWPVRKCSCSFCSAHPGHIYCADPGGKVTYLVKDLAQVAHHEHGTQADFLTCSSCGSYMGAVMELDEGRYTVINIEHLEQPVDMVEPVMLNFDGEPMEKKLARRSKNWTPFEGRVA